jgi:hypothetical protein
MLKENKIYFFVFLKYEPNSHGLPPSDGVFIRGRGSLCHFTLSSHAEGVGWLGGHYTVTRMACPIIIVVSHERGLGCVGVLSIWGERDRGREALQRRGRKPSSPTCNAYRFAQNAPFILNETVPKKSIFPNQSLIFYLFNQFLN